MEDFSKFLVKEHKLWSVFVHQNQSYLGRCVVWCNRTDALDLADATKDEQKELVEILRELREATKRAFQADWLNYAFLGNETRHLHCHFVPRYSSERIFHNITFTDKRWGHNYKTDHDFKISPEILEAIREKLANELLR